MKTNVEKVINPVPNKYDDIYENMDSKINNLIKIRGKNISLQREHRILDIEENEEALMYILDDLHKTFFEGLVQICELVYESHFGEYVKKSTLDLITYETKKRLTNFIETYRGYINPQRVYYYFFESNSYEYQKNIVEAYEGEYLSIKDNYDVQINMYYMENFILRLFGYTNLKVKYNHQQVQ